MVSKIRRRKCMDYTKFNGRIIWYYIFKFLLYKTRVIE